jgi:hypothetical protein
MERKSLVLAALKNTYAKDFQCACCLWNKKRKAVIIEEIEMTKWKWAEHNYTGRIRGTQMDELNWNPERSI